MKHNTHGQQSAASDREANHPEESRGATGSPGIPANSKKVDSQGPAGPTAREARAIKSVHGWRQTLNDKGRRRAVLPLHKPTTVAEAIALFDTIKLGIFISKVHPRTPIKDVQWLIEDIDRRRSWITTWGNSPPPEPKKGKDGGCSVSSTYGGNLWRGKIGQSELWTYGDSFEAVVFGLVDVYYQSEEGHDNQERWEQYKICQEVGHVLDPIDKSSNDFLCQLCGTVVMSTSRGKDREANPPYDPTFDEPFKESMRRYVLDQHGDVHEQKHIVMWATWMATANRIMAKTVLDHGRATVVTEFRGLCDRDPPLLFDVYVEASRKVFMVGRFETRVEAAVQHERAAKEIGDQCQNQPLEKSSPST